MIITLLHDASIIFEEDRFADPKVTAHARVILQKTRSHSSIVAESIQLQDSPDRAYFSLGADDSVAILVAVTYKLTSWPLLTHVYSLWCSTPSGHLKAQVLKLQDQQLSATAPESSVAAEPGQLRSVRLTDFSEVYFSASLRRDAQLFHDRAMTIRQKSKRKKSILLVVLCSMFVLGLVVSVCSKKAVDLAGCL